MRPLRTFALRNYITLGLCAIALIAFLASGLRPASGSRDVSPFNGNENTRALPASQNGNDTALTLNPVAGARRSARSDALELRLRSASIASPFAATLTATKTDNVSTPVDPGATIMYTVEITNTAPPGAGNTAMNVLFTDNLDANTTLVPGSVKVAPIAVDDSYNTIGNVNIVVPVAQGVIQNNDLNPNGGGLGTLSVTMVNATVVPPAGSASATTSLLGSVTMFSDGHFNYNPKAGVTGNDTFTYTLSNSDTPGKTDTATVTIAVNDMIWFVNSAVAPGGDGRLTTPFNLLSGAAAVDTASDAIFMYTSGTNYTGGITLESSELLIGEGASQSILTITGFATPSGTNQLPATGNATDPMITTAGTVAITLGTNNKLHGFTVGDTGAAGTDISGSSFGTLRVRDVSVKGTGRALNLATGTIDTAAPGSSFDLIETTGGDNNEGVRLNAVGGGFSTPTTNIVNPTGTGIDVQSSPAGTTFSFGATTVNKGASSGTGVNLATNSGIFSFSSLTVTTNSGTGVAATSSGTVNVTTGSITSTGGPALLVNPTAIGMTFTTVSSTNSGTTGISLTSASGSLSIGTTTVTNPTGIGISANTCSAALDFGNTTSTQSGGTGVSLTSNTGTIQFGTFNVTPDANQRGLLATENTMTITANSGGAVTTSGATAVEITRSSSTTPLLISLTSVTANGGTNGIKLLRTSGSFTITGDGISDPANTTRGRTTAKQGGGTVTLGSGGTINNTTGAAVSLDTTTNVTMRNLSLTGNAGGLNSGADGINAASSSGLTLDNVLVSGHLGNDGFFGSALSALTVQHTDIHTNAKTAGVDGLDIWDVRQDNLTGTCAVSNSLFFDTVEDLFTITNTGSSNLTLTVTNCEFRDTSLSLAPAVGDAGFQMLASGSAVTTLTATGCTFKNVRLTGFHYAGNNTASGTVKVMNSVFGGTAAGGDAANQNGVDIDIDHQGQGTTLNFEVSGNTTRQGFRANASTSINIFLAGLSTATSLMTGTVKNNIVGIAGTANSGSDLGAGIALDCTGAGTMTASVLSNTVNQVRANSGNVFDAGTSQTAKLNLKIRSNTFNGNPAQVNPQYGLHINAGTGTPGETNQLCIDMGLNSVTMPASAIASVALDSFPGTTTNLVGYTGAANNGIQIQNFLGSSPGTTPPGANTVTTPATLYTAAGGTTQPAVAPCNTFVFPTLVNPDVVVESINSPISDAPSESSAQGDNDPLRSTWGEAPNNESAQKLTSQALNFVVQAAIERWRQAGISSEDLARLQSATFGITDLTGDQLANTTSGQIKIDETGAGYGWYFDEFPMDDGEFDVPVPGKERQTTDLSPANGKMDLLTVVMRELGHVYMQGKTRLPKSMRTILQPLMEDTLSPGVRRMLVFNVPDRSTSRLTPGGGQSVAGKLAQATPPRPSTDSSTPKPKTDSSPSLLELKTAVFNPTADVAPGSYGRIAKRMSYASGPRPAAAARPMFADMVNLGPFTIPPGEKIVIMFNATVNAANTLPPGTTQVCNQGHVSATGISTFDTNDPDTPAANDATCTQLNVANVSVTKSAGSSPICSTSNITYTINYNNAGPSPALNALVSDVMPAGTSLVSVTTPATWTRSDVVLSGGNGTITFTKASSPNADAAVFTIVVSIDGTVADSAVIQNTATVSSSTPDPNTANNTSAPTSTTVKKPPTTATVGGPQTICALGTTASLGGNTPTIGTGTWTVQSGGTGTFNPNATTPGATFTHLTGVGPIVVRWTISNPPCADSFAEVTITIKAQPTATAGGAQTICALGTTASLGGNTPTGGATGTWSIVTAGVVGTFNPNAATPGATFTHTSGGIGTTITLRWTVSNAPCTDATADVAITIKSQPTATAGGPQTICAGGTTAGLGGNTPAAGETGTWSIVTAGTTGTFNPNANAPNATFTHATGGSPSFVLRWTVSNPPCTTATADVTITLLPAPVATAGGPQTICEAGTTASLGGNTPGAGETGTWSIVTAGVTGTFNPNANTPGATFTHTSGGAGGNITLRWTVTNPSCGQSATADVIITIKQQPTAIAGGAQTICALGTTASLGGNTPTGGATGTWSIVTGGATGTFNPNANTPGATFTHATGTGTITLRWTVSNAPCASAMADVLVTISQPPTTATVGANQSICALGTTAGLGGNTPSSGTGTWTVQSGGTGTFNPTAGTPNATFTHTGGAGPVVLRWTISNPPCPNSFAEVTITISQSPTAATVGSNQTICALGTTSSLGGNTPTSGTGTWTIQGGGTGTFNPTANTPGATFTHTGGTGPITLRWTISNPPCPDSFAELMVTITQPPTTATAGGPQTICAGSTTASLGGNTPSSGTGMWSIVTAGATGTFNPTANTPGATFTHTGGTGAITLRWTISNPPCPNSTADVIITVTQAPSTATVGGPQTICAGSTTAGLGGNTPTSGTGTWTVQSGGTGTFNPTVNTPNATFTHTGGVGPVVVRWTITNPPCPDSFAEVTITITQPPTTATVGGPQTICALSTTSGLGGNTPTSGTGTWTVQSGGTGTFNPNANTPNATFTHTGGAGPVVVRWTIANPPCPDSFAEVTITITQSPTTATVGGPQTICEGSTTASLGGNMPASGTGTWTVQSGGTGMFNPTANTPGATFTPTSGAGTFVLRWTIVNPPCPDSFAEVTVTVKQQPTATVGGPQSVCAGGTTASLGGNTPAGGAMGTWTIVTAGATGTFNPTANTPGATFTHTGGTGSITLRWTVSNPPCSNATADVVITVKQPVTPATVGPNQTIPPGGTTAPLGGNTPSSGTGVWSIVTAGATGTFNPNASAPNATWTHTGGSGQIVLRWTISNPPCPSSQADVTIQIGTPPTITCPSSPVMADATNGQCQAPVTFTVMATGIPSPTVMCSPASGSIFPVGNTTVMCTASNGVGMDATCSFTVTVKDTQNPVFTSCPSNINTSAQASCPYPTASVPVNFTVTATDNCSATVVCKNQNNQVVTSGQTFPVGTTTVTCTATDPSGNTATCVFSVTVFSGCVQDDSDPSKVVLFNAQTGQYRFCCGGTVYTGTGTLTVKGCVIGIQHNTSDRRVQINTDGSTGSASLQSPPGTTKCVIQDRNVRNNSCVCQ